MFKNYLKYLPKTTQLSIFICLWAGMLAIVAALQPWLIQTLTDLKADELKTFFENSLSKYPTAYFTINFLSSLGMFALPAITFAYLADPNPIHYLGLSKKPQLNQTALIILLSVLLIPLMGSLSGLLRNLDLGEASNALQKNRDAAIQLYLNNSDLLGLSKNVLLMALVPAIFEELFFRGVLQKFVFSFTKIKWLCFIIVGVVFALFHGSIYEFLPILLGSVIISYVYHYTSSMMLCILLHFLNNGIQVILASKNIMETANNETASNELIYTSGVFIGSLILTSFVLYGLFKNKTPLPNTWSVESEKSSQ